MRGRLMTRDFKLKKRAEKWINAIRDKFDGEALATDTSIKAQAEIGGFKML
jgi:hypothetical protein